MEIMLGRERARDTGEVRAFADQLFLPIQAACGTSLLSESNILFWGFLVIIIVMAPKPYSSY